VFAVAAPPSPPAEIIVPLRRARGANGLDLWGFLVLPGTIELLTVEVCSPFPFAQVGGSLFTSSRQSIGAVTTQPV
jgi:hypothetical protein